MQLRRFCRFALGLVLVCHLPAAMGQAPTASKTPPTDVHGDPLPVGAIARLGTVRLRHGDQVRSLAFSPNGKVLASRGEDGLSLWDTATGRPIRRFPDLRTDQPIQFIPDPRIDAIAFTADGKNLVVGPRTAATLLDIATGKKQQLVQLPSPTRDDSFTVTRDGRTVVIATASYQPPPSSGPVINRTPQERECKVELCHWGLATGKKQFTRHLTGTSGLYTLAPDPRAPDKAIIFSAQKNNSIKSWAADTGKPGPEFRGHSDGVDQLVASPDGKILASISFGKAIRLWDVTTGKLLQTLKQPQRFPDLTFSPDGKLLACWCFDSAIALWDVASGKLLRSLKASRTAALVFSPDGKMLATAEDCRILLWDTQTGKEHLDNPGHRSEIGSIAFAGDGKTLASAGADGSVYLWRSLDGSRPQLLAKDLGGILNLEFAPGSSLLAASAVGGVWLWNADTGNLVRKRKEMRWGRAAFFPGRQNLDGGW